MTDNNSNVGGLDDTFGKALRELVVRKAVQRYGVAAESATQDFLDGVHAAIEVASYSSGDMRGAGARPRSLKEFIYDEVGYRQIPEAEWSVDFRRGVDAHIAYLNAPAGRTRTGAKTSLLGYIRHAAGRALRSGLT